MIVLPALFYLLVIRRYALSPLFALPIMWAGGALASFFAQGSDTAVLSVLGFGALVVEVAIAAREIARFARAFRAARRKTCLLYTSGFLPPRCFPITVNHTRNRRRDPSGHRRRLENDLRLFDGNLDLSEPIGLVGLVPYAVDVAFTRALRHTVAVAFHPIHHERVRLRHVGVRSFVHDRRHGDRVGLAEVNAVYLVAEFRDGLVVLDVDVLLLVLPVKIRDEAVLGLGARKIGIIMSVCSENKS